MAPIVHLSLWLASCAAIFGCRTATMSAELPDPVGHVVDVHAKPWNADLAPDARIVETSPPAEGRRTQVVRRGRHQAFVVVNEAQPRDVETQTEFIYFMRDGRCFRIEGLPLPWRPLSDLAWASERYLVFDRWSQPHYGVHYIVDTVEQRVVQVAPFPDQFYLEH